MKIGFLMLDVDQSGQIDLKEYQQLTLLLGHQYAPADDDEDEKELEALSASHFKLGTPATTMAVHLFGLKGSSKLRYDQMKSVIDNLWLEPPGPGHMLDGHPFGLVRDFIDVYFARWDWHFPTFNVADSAITVGIALLAVETLRPRRAPSSAASGLPSSPE